MRRFLFKITPILIIATVSTLIFQGCKKDQPKDETPIPEPEVPFYRGGDFSFLPEIDESNTLYYNKDSVEENALSIFKSSGGNTVRIRLWNNPSNKHSALNEVTVLSNQVRSLGMNVWLNIHYSDWWADPGNQTKPAAWDNIPFADLVDSVSEYTFNVVSKIQPELVQIGNETNHGFLWPDGHRSNPTQFHTLLTAGIDAARRAKPDIKIMVHYAGVSDALNYYKAMDSLDFDQMAISYYPKWHTKDLGELEQKLNVLGHEMERDVVLAEVAYPFTLDWNDWTNNIIGSAAEAHPDYPVTVEGQAKFMGYLNRMLKRVKNGKGICYWAPEWVAYKGPTATDGSPWENQAVFNFNHVALPALDSLCQ